MTWQLVCMNCSVKFLEVHICARASYSGCLSLAAFRALDTSTRKVVSGHLTDSLFWVRYATELVGFADLVRRRPELAQTYLDAVKHNGEYRTYRRAFNIGEAFPRDDELNEKSLLSLRFLFANCALLLGLITFPILTTTSCGFKH
jgi:hypothetical protein